MVEPINKLRKICQASVIHKNTFYARKFARTFSIYFTKLFLYKDFCYFVYALFFLGGII